jgi:hypothetical protein
MDVWETIVESVQQDEAKAARPLIKSKHLGNEITVRCPVKATEVRLRFDPEKQVLHLEQCLGETEPRKGSFKIVAGRIGGIGPEEFCRRQILDALRF